MCMCICQRQTSRPDCWFFFGTWTAYYPSLRGELTKSKLSFLTSTSFANMHVLPSLEHRKRPSSDSRFRRKLSGTTDIVFWERRDRRWCAWQHGSGSVYLQRLWLYIYDKTGCLLRAAGSSFTPRRPSAPVCVVSLRVE